ncbi:MAG: response regulator transcription factor [Desulfobulbaceae bacterium]|nr:response regulator transcription factor [Candidatus Kapabacteria bacterium]MBS3999541.1 response regulator transcription factor [Desulfobulbaceae bacterium]
MLFDIDNPITAIIADDHEVVRAGIRRLLSIDKTIKILDDGANGEDAIRLADYHKPIVALLDILMPKMTGIQAINEIKKVSPTTYVIMLTAFEDAEHLELALAAGADGYLTKDISARDLIESIKLVTQGERVFSKSIIQIIQNKVMPSNIEDAKQVTITKREQDVLNLVAEGLTSAEIAKNLDLSIRTVESHRYNIMQKLGIKSAASLVKFAVGRNLR